MSERPVAVITGAGSGIGAAIATELAARGHQVVVADIDPEAAATVAKQIDGTPATVDVPDEDAVQALAESVHHATGRLDTWVSNAGISKMQKFVDISQADWDRTMAVNTKGVFLCGRAAARIMIAHGIEGRIINTASMAGKQGRVPFLADYVASKFAVIGLTQAMAFELAVHGIRVNAVCPGFVATPMQDRELAWEAELRGSDPTQVRQLWIDDTPLGRLQTPEDVARAVAFLASPDADFITGEALSVNGGAYMD
ncbi:MAG: SDR family NAD(P)-dependent oxidoreductase [Mycobacteriaceae bacterium]